MTKIANVPTITPAPEVAVTVAANPIATNTSALVIGAPGCTVSARLAGEKPPDGTLLRPGENFWKTWSRENTGTCTWDSTYKLVYQSGELMGGLTSYPLPELVAPGETKDISIYLRAPDTEGNATGYWSIQTPWNTYFGVGPTMILFMYRWLFQILPDLNMRSSALPINLFAIRQKDARQMSDILYMPRSQPMPNASFSSWVL